MAALPDAAGSFIPIWLLVSLLVLAAGLYFGYRWPAITAAIVLAALVRRLDGRRTAGHALVVLTTPPSVFLPGGSFMIEGISESVTGAASPMFIRPPVSALLPTTDPALHAQGPRVPARPACPGPAAVHTSHHDPPASSPPPWRGRRPPACARGLNCCADPWGVSGPASRRSSGCCSSRPLCGCSAANCGTCSLHSLAEAMKPSAGSAVALAALFTFLNYLILTGYDQLAFLYIRRPIAKWQMAMASFVGYAIANNVGFALLSGTSARYRFYSRWGLSGAGDLAGRRCSTRARSGSACSCSASWACCSAPWRASTASRRSGSTRDGGVLLLCVAAAYAAAPLCRKQPVSIAGTRDHAAVDRR